VVVLAVARLLRDIILAVFMRSVPAVVHGVVIIRASQAAVATTGSPTVTTVGSDTVYTFTRLRND
jgi:hypothetical protein